MSTVDTVSAPSGRERFWAVPLPLPPGLRLTQLEPVVVPRRGRGGETVFDVARLQTPSATVSLVALFRSPVTSKDVLAVRDQLRTVIDDLRLRSTASASTFIPYVPALATDVASRHVIDACIKEGLAVIDRRGTLIVHGGPVYVHVEGNAPVDRNARIRLFSGRTCRVVRVLLANPGQRFKPQDIATATQTSYALAHGALSALERDGFLTRSSPRAGFRLRDAAGLLKAWMDSGERTSIRATPYYAPNTRAEALHGAREVARQSGVKSVFTLASALFPHEVFVSGLPHGVYVSGDVSPIGDALKLERTTPHNFLVLRADPAADTSAGGIYDSTRSLPHGAGVSLPQLASDFAVAGGRGREQADRLLQVYAEQLPPPEITE